MAARKRRGRGPFLATLFTTVAAPVLVQVFTQVFTAAAVPLVGGARTEGLPAAYPSTDPLPQPAPIPAEIPVVAWGVGRTPQEALGDALRSALAGAVSTQTARDPGRRYTTLPDTAALPSEAGGVVTGWKDLGCTRVRGGWRRGLEVSIDHAALASMLKDAGAGPAGVSH